MAKQFDFRRVEVTPGWGCCGSSLTLLSVARARFLSLFSNKSQLSGDVACKLLQVPNDAVLVVQQSNLAIKNHSFEAVKSPHARLQCSIYRPQQKKGAQRKVTPHTYTTPLPPRRAEKSSFFFRFLCIYSAFPPQLVSIPMLCVLVFTVYTHTCTSTRKDII